MPDLSHLESWFSHDRLSPYRRAASDHRDAVALYEWNAEVSASFWRTLGHVEVLVRNALHRELTAWSQQRYQTDRWYAAIDPLVSEQTRRDTREAIRRGTRNGRAETPGRVVAELNLGFWRFLLARRYDGTLWRYCMYRAFPGKRRADVERAVSELHVLRNRIGHHEPIHNRPLYALLALSLEVASWIDPEAREWIAAGDLTPSLLAQRSWTGKQP
ncbi:hypothetical protein LWP59_09685 [Amycolatopsis acidiphila]|uniref:Abi family protein n=1 Tax=Amycolatopsis acidiphila TaxID=715473 RepID=A0A558A683_9PSEU|nr:hypothetical protein [Amycolatopsis acidiphila]TVT19770.1 hypothetical protein FNH06_23170 [Amycolatopsis acidiphila]UIJ61864.1 hypothetical protein LWP59_09685 [Amycolatopsis acidiphila]GHG57486.1 hypothetical protein GCM10017788_09130 [Amycolatopsis acidiphila]